MIEGQCTGLELIPEQCSLCGKKFWFYSLRNEETSEGKSGH